MTTKETTAIAEQVTCETCRKEIPISEAVVPEAVDYIAYFCGAGCYDKWRTQPGNPYTQDDISTRSAPL